MGCTLLGSLITGSLAVSVSGGTVPHRPQRRHVRAPARLAACAGAPGRLWCLQTAALVGFFPLIAMETVIKPRRLHSPSHRLSLAPRAPGRDAPVPPALPAAARRAWPICLSGSLFIQLPPLPPSGSPDGKQTSD